MRLLLDTHYVLWVAIAADHRLRESERALISDPSQNVAVSAVSLWELNIKWSKLQRDGEAALSLGPEDILHFWQAYGAEIASMDPSHAVALLHPPLEHPDPFDRLLLVQAAALGRRLLTRDARLSRHPQSLLA